MLEKLAEIFEEKFPNHDFRWKQYPTRWIGLCPFHDDKRPSFNIFIGQDGTARYKCFACGEGGSIYSIQGKKEKKDNLNLQAFIEASMEALLDDGFSLQKLEAKVGKGDLGEAIQFYRIGIVKSSILQEYKPLHRLLHQKLNIDSKEGWLIFPYYDFVGRVVAIKLRDIAKNSRFSRVFKLQNSPAYFGGLGFLNQYLKNRDGWVYPVLVVEGETDAIASYLDSSIPVLSVGSAQNYNFLLKLKVQEYDFFPVILPDFDEPTLVSPGAGIQAVIKLAEERKQKEDIKIYSLVDRDAYRGAKDICEGITTRGVKIEQIFQRQIEEIEKASKIFLDWWKEWKLSKFVRVAENLPSGIKEAYQDYLGIDGEESIELSLQELLKMPIKFKPAILGRFPPNKISVQASFGGSGKTTYAIMTAIKIAVREGLKVLLWTTEHSPASLKLRFKQITKIPDKDFWDAESLTDLHFRFGVPEPFVRRGKLNRKAFDEIELLLDRYDVLFLDPLLSFFGAEENDNSVVRAVFDRLHFILGKEKYEDRKKAIIFLHHFNKLALKEAVISEKDIQRLEDRQIEVKQEVVQKLLSAVRGASAVVDSARYVEAIIKTEVERYAITIKTNENTREAGLGEVIHRINAQPQEEINCQVDSDFDIEF